MDSYEATRIVFSRVQSLDSENATKIMGYLLIQDHGEKEMIRLAFGPETTLHSVVLKARKELCLVSSTPVSPSAGAGAPPHPFLLRQNSASGRILPPSPLAVSSPSWTAPLPFFSRSTMEELQSSEELVSPSNPRRSPFYNGAGAGDIMDEFHLLNDPTAVAASSNHSAIGSKLVAAAAGGCGDLFFPDVECRSPSAGNGDTLLLPYGMSWGVNGQHHRRSCSAAAAAAAADLYLNSDATGLGWKPCLYFARGYCKNGTACRFLHGLPDETTAAALAAAAAGAKMDAVVEQQCQELLLRSKSQRIATGGGMSQLMASAFPYSPTGGSVPPSPSSSSKCLNFLLQQHQNESQSRAAAALMLGGDESHKFMGRSRLERDFNPGSRQIYLTFPADSTFREEDVSNYFSIYGPVQDVRIPYQQKRMFGFVTFVYPETVKLILAKGNPHFVCDARVLVKPYKEKGKVPDKYRNKQQSERGDYSPTGLVDSRDPFDLHHLGARMLYNNGGNQELLLRRRLEEQQQALELQQAIELQMSRFMGLQLLDLKSRSLSASAPVSINSPTTTISTNTPTTTSSTSNGSTTSQEESPPEEDKSPIAAAAAPSSLKLNNRHGFLQHPAVNAAQKEESFPEMATPNEDSDFPDSSEHNLPDSPFASPTKSSVGLDAFSGAAEPDAPSSNITSAIATYSYMVNNNGGCSNGNSHILSPSFSSRFFQMPRFSSGHGAAGL